MASQVWPENPTAMSPGSTTSADRQGRTVAAECVRVSLSKEVLGQGTPRTEMRFNDANEMKFAGSEVVVAAQPPHRCGPSRRREVGGGGNVTRRKDEAVEMAMVLSILMACRPAMELASATPTPPETGMGLANRATRVLTRTSWEGGRLLQGVQARSQDHGLDDL